MNLNRILNGTETANWVIEEGPIEEGSQLYDMRLECRVMDAMAEIYDADVEFYQELIEFVIAHYAPQRMRIYLREIDTYLLNRVNLEYERHNFTNEHDFTRNPYPFQEAGNIATILWRFMLQFTENYNQDDDVDMFYKYRIIIDIEQVNHFGNCGNGQLPIYFPPQITEEFLFNPLGTDCAYKCVSKYLGNISPEEVKAKLNLPSNVYYEVLIKALSSTWVDVNWVLVDFNMHLMAKAYAGKERSPSHCYLMLTSHHYFLITSHQAFCKQLRGNPDAVHCNVCFNIYLQLPGEVHDCETSQIEECPQCGKEFVSRFMKYRHKPDDEFTCEPCNGCGISGFKSKVCQKFHRDNCKSYKLYKNAQVRRSRIHCAGCGKQYKRDTEHICFFDRQSLPDEDKYEDYYVFDFESMFISNERGNIHQVNYVVVAQLWSDAKWEFDTLEEFVQWIVSIADERSAKLVAHNFKGYDGRLLLEELVKTPGKYCENFVQAGSKLNSFTYGKLTFSDSLLHISAALDNFPAIFGLNVEDSKGFFPYEFNTPENQNYIGDIPALDYFKPDKMSSKRRSQFLEWYAGQQGIVYNFKQEMIKYCIQDVVVLKKGLEIYIARGKEINSNINPMDSMTIAAYSYKVWRTLYMPEETIAIYGAEYHKSARAALRGGRTDVRVLYKSWSIEDVFIKKKFGVYADVQSMYPYIQMNKELPVGKPKRRKEGEYIPGEFGIVHCSLKRPTTYVHHPAICIPDKGTGRLVAPLFDLDDIHICSIELDAALAQGYTLKRFMYIDVYSKSTDLFKSYVRAFLKVKVEKSKAYPGDEKFKYLHAMYKERCGIELDADNFEDNPGSKNIAKNNLNNLWGKLCERPKYDFTQHCDMERFFQLEQMEELYNFNPKLKLRISDTSWIVRGEYMDDNHFLQDMANRKKVSPAIGSFITMYGRMMLFEQMKHLKKRVMYHDTDSIIYEREEGLYNIPLGECLGDWEDELKGQPMIEFVSIAPKTYAYRYLDKPVKEYQGKCWEWEGMKYPIKEVVKVKGVRQSYESATSLDFDGLRALVDREKSEIKTEQLMFLWDQKKMQMRTKWQMKATIMNYVKGIRGDDYMTYPPGATDYFRVGTKRCEEGDPLINA